MALTCKTSLSGLNTGDYVWCKYTAGSGAVGALSDIATKTDDTIPLSGTTVTLDPSTKGANVTMSNGNLSARVISGSSWVNGGVKAPFGVTNGKWYWEVTTPASGALMASVGICNASWTTTSYPGLAGNTNSLSWLPYWTNTLYNGVITAYGSAPIYGDIIGVALDLDDAGGKITFYKNGVSQGVAYSDVKSKLGVGAIYPAIGCYSGALEQTVNFSPLNPPSGHMAVNSFSSLIPTASTATPNGYFKFICVGEDYLGRMKLVADRNLQHTIPWDAFNTQGAVNGLSLSQFNGDSKDKLVDPTTLPPSRCYGTAFSPDGVYMVVSHTVTPFISIYKRTGDTFTKLADPTTLPTGSGSFGITFSPDGIYMVVPHSTSPFVSIYKRTGDTFTKLPDPTTLPTGGGCGASFSPDGVYMSVAHATTPFVTIYKRSGDTFTKLTNPVTLPTGGGYSTSFSPDGVYVSVAHATTPFVTIYKRSGDTFTKLTNPVTLPTDVCYGTAFSPDGVYMSTVCGSTPFVTIYKRSGDTFTKLTNPTTLPPNTSYGTAFSPDGLYLTVAHATTPFITMYKRFGDTFTKLPDPTILPPDTSYGTAFSPDGLYMTVAHSTSPFVTIYKASMLLSNMASFNITQRILTGGVTSADINNEWDNIIVGSTLNSKITAGDNSIWNWSGIHSHVSTRTTGASVRVRGNTAVNGSGSTVTTLGYNSEGFRPVLIIESLGSSKFLLQDGTEIFKVLAGVKTKVGDAPIIESMFTASGMDDLTAVTSTVINGMTQPKVLYYKV